VVVLVAMVVTSLLACSEWFSRAIFGSGGSPSLVTLAALALVALVGFNTWFELFGGLRLFRLAAAMQFFQSLLFAGLGVALALTWQPTALSLVAAFGGASALCWLGALPWLRKAWRSLPADTTPLAQRDLWRKLIPFAASVWIANWLANLFDLA